VAPFERRVPWAVAQEQYPVSYEDEYNLLPKARRHELSHHLAHLWSAITQAPFDQGLCVVMDGMGELRSAMTRALR
jgi:predicted NodU family carbamoyl transferase